jgi:hypothetical protein
MRYVILHHHFFKNAGTSLDAALEDQFGPSFFTFHDPGPDGIVTPLMLMAFLEEHPQAVAVSSHHFRGARFAQSDESPIRFMDILLLRDPIARLCSTFNFLTRNDDGSEIARIAQSTDPLGFVEELLANQPHVIDNNQVNIIANRGFYCRPVAEWDLQAARDRVRSFALYAPVDRFDEAMVALEHDISPSFAPHRIRLDYVRQNVSSYDTTLQEFERAIGHDLLAFVRSLNVYDSSLIASASAELDRRIAGIRNFPAKLAEFRERCATKAARYALASRQAAA